MCRRFTQKLTWSQIHDLYSLTASVVPLNQPRYNGAPEQEFAACRLDDGGNRTMVQLRWGLVPSWTRDVGIATRLINARSETIHTKPSFGAAFRSRRCLVPADGWFEWQRTGYGKQPYFLALEDGGYSPLYTFLRSLEPVPSLKDLKGELRHYEQWNIDEGSVVSFAAIHFGAASAPP